MSNASRKARGLRTQLCVANWYAENGWPFAQSAGAGRPGVDVLGMPALAPEVKARREFQPKAWLKQAIQHTDKGLPFVVFRPDGMGEQSIGEWGVLMTLADHTGLLWEAGYGTPPGSDGSQ